MLRGKNPCRALALPLVIAGLLALWAGTASAATYLGPNPPLNGEPEHTQAILFAAPVVLVNVAGPPGQVLTAPVSGVITSWRLYTGEVKGAAATAQLRVLKLKTGNEYEAVSSGPVQPVDEVTAAVANKSYMHEFKLSLPISAGETIGVGLANVLTPPQSYVLPALPAVEGQGWKYGCMGCATPAPADGSSATAAVVENQWVAMSAQIEPDENHNGLGDETQEPAACVGACGGSGTGPAPAPAKTKCKKGKRLKHGKCVKRHKKKHPHHHRSKH
jgi:hypothetical protein